MRRKVQPLEPGREGVVEREGEREVLVRRSVQPLESCFTSRHRSPAENLTPDPGVCVCVCVKERERERRNEREIQREKKREKERESVCVCPSLKNGIRCTQ